VTAPAPRLPVEPLLELCGGGVHTAATRISGETWRGRRHDAVSHRLHEARRLGGLTWFTADRYAIALGLHPIELWPQEWPALDDLLSVGAHDSAADENGPGCAPRAIQEAPLPAVRSSRAA
jgi:hypothetical protein